MATVGQHVILWGNWGASAQVANTPLDQYEKAPPISTLSEETPNRARYCVQTQMAIDKIDVVSDPRIDKCTAILNGRTYGEHAVKLT
jgi:hypothetical protein